MGIQDKDEDVKDKGNIRSADNGKVDLSSCIGCFGAADGICQRCWKMQIVGRVDKS